MNTGDVSYVSFNTGQMNAATWPIGIGHIPGSHALHREEPGQ